MISPLYFKPSKRSAGGDLMISFVMEKCLILPMCVGVQNTKKKKKLSVLWAIAQLRVIQTTHVRRGVPKHTYTVLFSLLIVITQQWRKVALRQLQDFLLKFAALWQRTDGLLYSHGIFSKVFLRSLSLLGRIFAFSFSLVKKKQINASRISS